MRVLGIETSCDETGVAVYDRRLGLLSHCLYSQVDTHREYGGVVPELASRDHIRKLLPLIRRALDEAASDRRKIDGIAYTAGPGLAGALLAGAAVAASLAWAWQVPVVPVHHMEAHLLAPMLEDRSPEFPFLALLVSGGHTQLVFVAGVGRYQVMGDTLDDAVGEAFDKTAKLLGLPYPGGPALARLAERGNAARFELPRPMTDRPGLEFSFSGLKTHVVNTWRSLSDHGELNKADLAASFQEAVVDTLVIKCRRAIRESGLRRLVVAGGVGANQRLRQRLDGLSHSKKIEVYFPRIEYCTDNGAMVAHAGCLRLNGDRRAAAPAFGVRARWPLEELVPVIQQPGRTPV